MAKFGTWRNGFLEIAGVDLSNHCREFSVEEGMEELDHNAHGDSVKPITPGLDDWTMQVEFLQDFASGSVHFTLHNAKQARAAIAVRWRASADAVGPTNPMYSGSAYVTAYTGFQGAHGDNLMASATLRPAIGTPLVETTS